MSDLLNKASLVMVPSGYKEDTVYSVVPSDGSGDLSFTRASNGTRVNSAGLVEVCPWNLLEQSETFDNGYWGKNNLSVSANSTTAPNGTITADTLTTTSTAQCQLLTYFDFLVGNYTLSFYVKKVDLGFTYVEFGYAFCWVNLTTGAITGGSQYSTGWTFVSANASSVGDGWFKVEMVASCSIAGSYGVRPLQPVPSSGAYDSLATNKATYLWGAQVNIGSTAKPYFPTTDRLNVPRLTYQNGGGGCPSLLLEKQSTNLVTYSEQFDNADWNKYQCSISANQTTSPDGTQNADKLTLAGGSGTYTGLAYRTTTPGANSIFMKNDSIGNGKFYIQVDGIGNASWNSDGTLVSVSGGTATNGENMGNGWFRFTYVCSGGAYINYGIENGTTGDSIFIWGAQVESGSYATSYISTTSSSATRVADACYKTGISSLIGQTEGVIFFDGYFGNETDEMYAIIQNSLGNSTTSSMYLIKSSSSIKFQSYDSSTTLQWEIQGGLYTIGQRIKIAGAYKANDIVLYVNGVQIGTDTSATIATCTALQIGVYPASPTANFQYNGKVNEVILFPTRLTNAELASLTTI